MFEFKNGGAIEVFVGTKVTKEMFYFFIFVFLVVVVVVGVVFVS